ncbi:MAG: NAD(P)H-dependent oxidoreductase subunit E [Deltaproteobacteria bacterium]|nr:NAD(P)H-dependent oxidoreductase subunit E [Deltaproteobacteria bacterium]
MDSARIGTDDAERVAMETAVALAELGAIDGPLLPVLHRLMARLGRIPPESIPVIARALGLSRAEVHGVVTYYADFRIEPLGERVVEVCRAEACQARGAGAVLERARRITGCGEGETCSADGRASVVPVFCLGLCASAPAVRIDARLHARVTPDRLEALLAEKRVGGSEGADGPGIGAMGSSAGSVTASASAASPAALPAASPAALSARTPAHRAGAPVRRVFVAGDSAARAVGADEVAEAIAAWARGHDTPVEIHRTSSRGAFWLEPLVEVETPAGRVGYGPVSLEALPALMAAGLLEGGAHPLALGPVEQLAYLAKQDRRLFARAGRTAPLSLDDYRSNGGGRGLHAARALPPDAIVAAVLESGLRGRGGAAFPAGIKWRTVAGARASQKYVVCNADEGDSGTFADRMLLEGDPFLLLEGMTIAARAVGASRGFVYVRSEYPDAIARLRAAIAVLRDAGWLGVGAEGGTEPFDVEVRVGAGSYVCGEETAMLESLEGRRGIVRAKPPLPALRGLFGQPTLIQNVLTFAAVPEILAGGAAAYRALGTGRSTGTMPFQLAGNIRRGGLVELPFGVSLRTLVFEFGGGSASGRPVKAIQVGGPLGCYVPESRWDEPLDYERYAAFGAGIGHGGIVVHDDGADLAELARYAMAFCAQESCGKCTPCRIGSTRGVELIDRIRTEREPARKAAQVGLLRDLCATMVDASLCAMGGMTPLPVLSALDHYGRDFGIADEGGGPGASGSEGDGGR